MEEEQHSESTSDSDGSVDEDGDDYGEEEEEDVEDNLGKKSTKKKKRRSKKARGHRKNIKSKYDTIDDLNPEALSAQTEEAERIRRLELQRSIMQSSTINSTVRKNSVKRSVQCIHVHV